MNDKMLIKQLKANHSELIIEENRRVFWGPELFISTINLQFKKLQCP